MGTELVSYCNDVQMALVEELNRVKSALPVDFNGEKFILNAIAALKNVKDIEKVHPKSVIETLKKGAFLGLDFFNGECYAIKYDNSVQFQTDYKGEIKLIKKYSTKPVDDIYAEVVREGDKFSKSVNESGARVLTFEPLPFNNNKIIGVFAMIKYMDGTCHFEDLSLEEVENIRNTYSKAKNSKAWLNSYGEMVKKTAIRRLTKHVSLEFNNKEQIEAFNAGGDCDFIDIEPEPVQNPFIEFETQDDTNTPEQQKLVKNERETGLELRCAICGASISQKVYDYSINKFGEPLCFEHQEGRK